MKRRAAVVLPRVLVLAAALASIAFAADADDDRGVARISLINGDVSVRRGDSGDWVAAAINAPLVSGDQVATGSGSRAEIQLDHANFVRLSADSEVRLSDLTYTRYQVQVARGTVLLRVLRDSDAQVEINTPSVSVRPAKKGEYRISVSEPNGQDEITVRSGQAEIYTARGVERLDSGKSMLVRSTAGGEPEFQIVKAMEPDDFDRWSDQRDRTLERSGSYRYMSRDIYGGEDLDGHGRWVYTPEYGWVWAPNVAPGWAPYRHGRWVWEDWYGWTWLSYDPWGWAPFHYGRWFYGPRYGWCWYPGGFGVRHYWRPALVAFFGFGGYRGVQVGIGFGNVGWVPLAPYEPYYPWYGRGYYGAYRNRVYVDRSINVTRNINIVNVYRNARIHNGITAVGYDDFSRGRLQNIVRVRDGEVRQASLMRGQLPLVPSADTLRYSDRRASVLPRNVENRRFFGSSGNRAERIPFAEQQRSLEQLSRRAGGGFAADSTPGAVSRIQARDSEDGWRRMGQSRSERAISPNNSAASPALQRTEASAGDGWRRFGQPRTAPGGAIPRSPERTRPDGNARSGNGNARSSSTNDSWQRFGSAPARENGSISRGSDAQPSWGSRSESWSRFGEPRMNDRGNSPASRGNETPRNSGLDRETGRAGERFRAPSDRGSERFQNFGNSPGSGMNRSEALPRMDQGRQFRDFEGSRGQRLQIAPPVVRERSMPRAERSMPRMESSGGARVGGPGGGGPRSSGGVSRSDGGSRGGGGGRGGGGRNR